MRNRVERLAPGQPCGSHVSPLFAPAAARFAPLVGLRDNYTIYDTSDSLQALRRVIDEVGVDSTHYTPQQIAGAISAAEDRLITAEQYAARPGSPIGSIVARVYPAYQGGCWHRAPWTSTICWYMS